MFQTVLIGRIKHSGLKPNKRTIDSESGYSTETDDINSTPIFL